MLWRASHARPKQQRIRGDDASRAGRPAQLAHRSRASVRGAARRRATRRGLLLHRARSVRARRSRGDELVVPGSQRSRRRAQRLRNVLQSPRLRVVPYGIELVRTGLGGHRVLGANSADRRGGGAQSRAGESVARPASRARSERFHRSEVGEETARRECQRVRLSRAESARHRCRRSARQARGHQRIEAARVTRQRAAAGLFRRALARAGEHELPRCHGNRCVGPSRGAS